MAPPQFPNVDPATLAQLIRTYVRSRQNVSAVSTGSSADYGQVVNGWADAIAAGFNPSLSSFKNTDDALIAAISQLQQQQQSGIPTLLFFSSGPMAVGNVVYQVSSDTVALADNSSITTGPAVGIVTSIPGPGQARVQNISQYTFNLNLPYPFLPLVPDTTYYVGISGNITATPTPGPGGYLQEIGYAKTTSEFVLHIEEETEV